MTTDEKHRVLSDYSTKFRAWSYAELAARIAADGEPLETAEGVARDGTRYSIEVNVFWDDKPHGNIRVCSSFSADPQIALPGGGFMPDVCDDFIMSPDGRFAGE